MSATLPKTLPPNVELMPVSMKVRPQWVAVRLVPTGDPDRPLDKIPINPATGRKAKTNDPSTWGTIDEALARMKRDNLGGIGYVLSADDPFSVIDRDKCVNPETHEIAPEAWADVERFGTYAEISGSGTGLHYFVEDDLPEGEWRKQAKLECYGEGRLVWMTGCPLVGYETIRSIGDDLAAWHREHAPVKPARPKPAHPSTPISRDTEEVLTRVLRTEKGRLLHEGGNWKGTGYPSQSEADQALCNLYVAAGATRAQADDLFRRSGLLRDKWDKRHHGDGRTYGEGTLDTAFDGSVQVWADDASGTEGPNKQDTQSPPTPPPDPIPELDVDNLPDDAPTLKRIISELRRIERETRLREEEAIRRIERAELRIEAAEQRAIAAEAKVRELSLLQSKTMAAFRSKNFGSEKATGVALAFEILNQQTADPTRTEFPICNDRLADQTGMSASAVAGHVKEKLPRVVDPLTGEVIELFERKLRYTPGGTDPTTGEDFAPKTQAVFVPKVDPMKIIDLIATAAPVSGKRKNNHGGKADRGRLCPDHPTAAVVKRVTYHCSVCDQIVAEDAPVTLPSEQVAQSVDADPGRSLTPSPIEQDAESVPSQPIPQRGYHYRGGPEPNYHNVEPPMPRHNAPPGSVAEAWQHAQPMPGFAPPPADRWSQ